ncbi:MAG TPA: pyruvate kinase, partial [Geminicoccaceae bacterium]
MSQRDIKTKIVCTIGPASRARDTIAAMIEAGMNVARLNFAHGTFEEHAAIIADVRAAARDSGRRVAILADLPGPKLRIGPLAEQPVELERGHEFTLEVGEFTGDASRASTTFDRLPQAVKPGDTIFLNDGLVQLVVATVRGGAIRCEVAVGGPLLSNKGINLPDVHLGIDAFTERDRQCLAFALEHGVDAVSQSFVEDAEDIRVVREAARSAGRQVPVIAKIERAQALRRIDEILAAADGVMVARGDLGVEIPIESIAVAQKELIDKANRLAKPAITATQMLLSMVENRRPTRAEVTDVANAILDGTDCVMLSEESAVGAHPVEAVRMLSRIAKVTEAHLRPRLEPEPASAKAAAATPGLVAVSVADMAVRVRPAGILVPSHTGMMARRIARYRLPAWITAVSAVEATCQALQFVYGVEALHQVEPPASWYAFARAHFKDRAKAQAGARILLTEDVETAASASISRL